METNPFYFVTTPTRVSLMHDHHELNAQVLAKPEHALDAKWALAIWLDVRAKDLAKGLKDAPRNR